MTSAGYLPAASVAALRAELDPEARWPGVSRREIDFGPLLRLRECVTSLGLLRKSAGRLTLTANGKRLRDDPLALWRHIASRLPVERSESGSDIGLLLLLLVAAGEAASRLKLMFELEMLAQMIGWEFDDPTGGHSLNAYASINRTADVLDWIGRGSLIVSDPRVGFGDPAAKKLARAALGCWESGG
jgi:hypothetical protein